MYMYNIGMIIIPNNHFLVIYTVVQSTIMVQASNFRKLPILDTHTKSKLAIGSKNASKNYCQQCPVVVYIVENINMYSTIYDLYHTNESNFTACKVATIFVMHGHIRGPSDTNKWEESRCLDLPASLFYNL